MSSIVFGVSVCPLSIELLGSPRPVVVLVGRTEAVSKELSIIHSSLLQY